MPRSKKRKAAEDKRRKQDRLKITARGEEIVGDWKKLNALERKLKAKNKETN